jgi:hypothetical protein
LELLPKPAAGGGTSGMNFLHFIGDYRSNRMEINHHILLDGAEICDAHQTAGERSSDWMGTNQGYSGRLSTQRIREVVT